MDTPVQKTFKKEQSQEDAEISWLSVSSMGQA